MELTDAFCETLGRPHRVMDIENTSKLHLNFLYKSRGRLFFLLLFFYLSLLLLLLLNTTIISLSSFLSLYIYFVLDVKNSASNSVDGLWRSVGAASPSSIQVNLCRPLGVIYIQKKERERDLCSTGEAMPADSISTI